MTRHPQVSYLKLRGDLVVPQVSVGGAPTSLGACEQGPRRGRRGDGRHARGRVRDLGHGHGRHVGEPAPGSRPGHATGARVPGVDTRAVPPRVHHQASVRVLHRRVRPGRGAARAHGPIRRVRRGTFAAVGNRRHGHERRGRAPSARLSRRRRDGRRWVGIGRKRSGCGAGGGRRHGAAAAARGDITSRPSQPGR